MSALKKHVTPPSLLTKAPGLHPQAKSSHDVLGEVIESRIDFQLELTQCKVISLKRGPKVKWHFSECLAEAICELIAHGQSLEAISKRPGFPSMWVIRRWRLEHPEFNDMIADARSERQEYFLGQMLSLIPSLNSKQQIPRAKFLFSFYKWASQIRDPGTFGKSPEELHSVC